MRINRLELFGFKSFKDKTVIPFDENITAVVGSNGCGKSNIVDALFWVMGDMSPKHLRGSSMVDVIFSGTKEYPSMDVAEVTLILDRDPATDPELPPQFNAANEVQITRRYYRIGESEYFINKVPCRLRDIQEFFMDTGIGAKGYSIIEQGAISRMVSQKPEDRRTVIEEVAGIIKYKARRAETLRKIEATKINLNRIEDIVKDVERQLSSLKRQATKAEKHKDLTEALKTLEFRVAVREWTDRTTNQSDSSTLQTELQAKITELDTELSQERVKLVEQEHALQDIEVKLEAQRLNTRQSEVAVKEVEGTISTLNTKEESYHQRIEDNNTNISEIEDRIVTISNQLQDLLRVKDEFFTKQQAFSDEIDTKETTFKTLRTESNDIRNTLSAKRADLHKIEIEQTKQTQEIQNLQQQVTTAEEKLIVYKKNITDVDLELEKKEQERGQTMQNLQAAFAQRQDLESERATVDAAIEETEKERNQVQDVRDKVQHELTQIHVRKEHLEAMDRNLDGIGAAAKEVAKHLREQGAEQAILADYIKVPQVLENALEAALSTHAQRVKIDKIEDFKSFEDIIKNSDNPEVQNSATPFWIPGKAGLSTANLDEIMVNALPGETVKPKSSGFFGGLLSTHNEPAVEETTDERISASTYLNLHPEVIGCLKTLITNEIKETRKQDWVDLLEEFWVVKDRNCFIDLYYKFETLPVNFISLEGDLLTKEGYLTLSPNDKTTPTTSVSLITRKRDIEELGKAATENEATLSGIQQQFTALTEKYKQSKIDFQNLAAKLSVLSPDVEKKTMFLGQVEAQAARLQEKKELLTQNISQNQTLVDTCNEKLESLQTILGETEASKQEMQSLVSGAEAKLTAQLNEQTQVEASLEVLKTSAKQNENELIAKQKEIASLEQEKNYSETRKAQLKDEINMLNTQSNEIIEQIAQANEKLSTLQETFTQAKTIEDELALNASTQKQDHKVLRDKVDQLSADYQTNNEQFKDIEQLLAVNQVEIKNIRERLLENYQTDLETMSDEDKQNYLKEDDLVEMADPETAKARVSELRRKIDKLGKINMVAMEEYDELSQRHEFMFVQREDLSESIDQLQDAVNTINKESVTRFSEAFDAVNHAFQKTFPVLFGGGNAELKLTNPEDMLETGVEIIAQPPGKKLQSITLLSGGEKALTAVSLILGIFSIKPSPFAVLDEVDAPLDDANVNRFNKQVREMVKFSQIIMITHNKKTMESADSLFGVTMEQPGVTKIASAKLGDLKVTPANV